MPTKTTTIEDLRQRLEDAQRRREELRLEGQELPARIREVSQAISRQKADAARRGEPAAGVAAELDLAALQEREKQLPLEMWVARLTAAEEVARDLHQAELEEAVRERDETRAAAEVAEHRFNEAKQAHEEAWDRSNMASVRAQNLQIRLRDLDKSIQAISEDYPGA
jgi:chromosome segregation ATPase